MIVREKKRSSQRPDLTETRSNNYDHLRDDNNPKQSDLILDSYDQLDCPPPYSSIHGLQEPRGNHAKTSSHGNVNETYEDTEGCIPQRNSNQMEECGALYFELERDSVQYKDSSTYERPPPSAPEPNTIAKTNTGDTSPSRSPTSDAPQPSPSTSRPQSPTYNEAISLADSTPSTTQFQRISSNNSDSESDEDVKTIEQNTESTNSNQNSEAQSQSASKDEPEPRKVYPIAAPRKKSLIETPSSFSEYDIAEPIEEL